MIRNGEFKKQTILNEYELRIVLARARWSRMELFPFTHKLMSVELSASRSFF